MRERIVERKHIKPENKAKILLKSSGKCAHCGKPLTVKSATVDHAIPISKGGTNDDDNLVALCLDCNNDKFDAIVDPVAYFKYLLPEYVDIIKSYHDAYCEDISWLSPKNYMKEDRIEVSYASYSKVFNEHRTRKGNNLYAKCIRHSAVLYKATYEDLDEVREYLLKYHKKYNLYIDELDDAISDMFSLGCIYILKRGAEILAVFPVKISRWPIVNDTDCYLITFSGAPVIYQRREYMPLIRNCIQEINAGFALANGKNIALYGISYPDSDQYISAIVDELSRYGGVKRGYGDGWHSVILCQRWSTFEGENKGKEFDLDEDALYYSRSLERIMNLRPASTPAKSKEVKKSYTRSKRRNSEKVSQINKERRRMERELIDEYDERYYV